MLKFLGVVLFALKNSGDDNEKSKAHHIAQGHLYRDNPFMVYDTTTLLKSSVITILSISAVKGFRLLSHDVNQAYVRSKGQLSRKVYILPIPEYLHVIGIKEDQILEFLRPLYCICDPGDYLLKMISIYMLQLGILPYR